MNKTNIIILLVSVMVVLWTSFAVYNYSLDEANPLVKELKQLKKGYDDCDKDKWCCKKTDNDGLIEKECRQF